MWNKNIGIQNLNIDDTFQPLIGLININKEIDFTIQGSDDQLLFTNLHIL